MLYFRDLTFYSSVLLVYHDTMIKLQAYCYLKRHCLESFFFKLLPVVPNDKQQ